MKTHMHKIMNDSFVLMAQQLDRMSMSMLKCASSPLSNPFATFVKDIPSRSTKKQ